MVESRYGTESYGNSAVGGEVADDLVVESCGGIAVGEIICQRRHLDCHGQSIASRMMETLCQPGRLQCVASAQQSHCAHCQYQENEQAGQYVIFIDIFHDVSVLKALNVLKGFNN